MTDKLTYGMILAAKLGDPRAITTILQHYEKQINRAARQSVDPDVAQQIQDALIFAILFDFDPTRLPEGETLEQ